MRGTVAQPISQLARWIVARRIVTVPTPGLALVPMFQFQAGLSDLHPALEPVLRELVGVFDDLDVATWFATSNRCLNDAAPADVLTREPTAVFHAARLDRFVASGA